MHQSTTDINFNISGKKLELNHFISHYQRHQNNLETLILQKKSNNKKINQIYGINNPQKNRFLKFLENSHETIQKNKLKEFSKIMSNQNKSSQLTNYKLKQLKFRTPLKNQLLVLTQKQNYRIKFRIKSQSPLVNPQKIIEQYNSLEMFNSRVRQLENSSQKNKAIPHKMNNSFSLIKKSLHSEVDLNKDEIFLSKENRSIKKLKINEKSLAIGAISKFHNSLPEKSFKRNTQLYKSIIRDRKNQYQEHTQKKISLNSNNRINLQQTHKKSIINKLQQNRSMFLQTQTKQKKITKNRHTLLKLAAIK